MSSDTGYRPANMRAAILFFCDRIRNGTLGRTKLAKLLYYLDFDHYEKQGESVTGAEYLHWARGPYPKQLRTELRNLVGASIEEEVEQVGPYHQYSYRLRRGNVPDLEVFSKEELVTLYEVSEKWERQTAAEMVAATHGEAPWIATGHNETIPYEYAYYRRRYDTMEDSEDENEIQPLVSVD